MEPEYLDFQQTEEMITKLEKMIRESGFQFDRVVGIANGGLNISIPLAERFNKPHEQIRISYYANGYYAHDESQVVIDVGDFNPHDSSFLLVDDLVDSGATLDDFCSRFNIEQGEQFKTAVLYWNPVGRFKQKPEFFVDRKYYRWIVFPWESANV